MKKLLLIGFGALMLTTLASCKKDWTCVCQSYGEVSQYTIYGKTKKQAKNQCTDAVSVGLVTVGGDNDCNLK